MALINLKANLRSAPPVNKSFIVPREHLTITRRSPRLPRLDFDKKYSINDCIYSFEKNLYVHFTNPLYPSTLRT